MSNIKTHTFSELEAVQFGNALKATLREKSPLKLTLTRCAKEMERALQTFSDKKNLVMEEIVVKDEEGNLMTVEGLEGEPKTLTDYQLSVEKKEAIKRFESIAEEEVDVELPIISGDSKVIMDGEKVSLEDYLNMNPDASGSLAYVYLILCD